MTGFCLLSRSSEGPVLGRVDALPGNGPLVVIDERGDGAHELVLEVAHGIHLGQLLQHLHHCLRCTDGGGMVVVLVGLQAIQLQAGEHLAEEDCTVVDANGVQEEVLSGAGVCSGLLQRHTVFVSQHLGDSLCGPSFCEEVSSFFVAGLKLFLGRTVACHGVVVMCAFTVVVAEATINGMKAYQNKE